MRHRKLNKRFGRNKSKRKQLMLSLVRALFISHRIETTVEKAKEARRLAEKLITRGKKATLSDIRAIDSVLQDRTLTRKLIQQIAPLFKERKGGYTRVVRTGFRRGDGAPLAVLELMEKPSKEKKPKKEKKVKKEKPALPEEKIKPVEVEKRPVGEIVEKKPEEKKRPKEEKAALKKGLFDRLKGFFKKK